MQSVGTLKCARSTNDTVLTFVHHQDECVHHAQVHVTTEPDDEHVKPHAKLGEDVAAAVVLKEGTSASEEDLRKFASSRLAAFKVPRRVVILTEIPKGATGKLQRIGLAQKLGLSG